MIASARLGASLPLAVLVLLAGGALSTASGAESTDTIAVRAHLRAVTDPSSLSPRCGFYGPFADCGYVDYRGEGVYTGDLIGDLRYSGHAHLERNGSFTTRENDTFTGTVRGCGSGGFDYTVSGSGRGFDAATGDVVGDEVLSVVPGSGSSTLAGLVGGMHGTFAIHPDGSIDADYVGTLVCPSRASTTAARTRLLLGATRGTRGARRGRPFKIRVRAVGGRLHGTRIVVRNSRGRPVGRSKRFSLGQRRKLVRVWVSRRLAAGRYRIVAAGHDATGRRVRAARSLRLRRASR